MFSTGLYCSVLVHIYIHTHVVKPEILPRRGVWWLAVFALAVKHMRQIHNFIHWLLKMATFF